MSRQQCAEKAQVTFHDVSAYFSDEEWTLLHEWQKELYRNVMNEIHQALLSLGPLIATTVLSLSAKDKQKPGPVDNLRKPAFHNAPSDVNPSPDVLFRLKREEQLCLKNPQNTEGRERKDCVGTEEEKVSIFIDHLGVEVGESSTDPNSDHEVVAFRIKDEDEKYYMDHHESRRSEIVSSLTGDETMNRKVEVGESVKCTGKNRPCNTLSEKANLKIARSSEKEAHCSSQLWSEINPKMDREAATQCESGFSNLPDLHFYQGTPKEERSEQYRDSESNLSHTNLITNQPNIQENWSLYSSTECEKTLDKMENIIVLKKTHTGVKPYQCTECEKSFSKKANLFVHRRTHTGERPYHCIICNKSFSQTGVLNRHQRTHTGERPYQCTECRKCFSQKGDLIAHQRKHKNATDYHPRCKGPARSIPEASSVTHHILSSTKPNDQPHL